MDDSIERYRNRIGWGSKMNDNLFYFDYFCSQCTKFKTDRCPFNAVGVCFADVRACKYLKLKV